MVSRAAFHSSSFLSSKAPNLSDFYLISTIKWQPQTTFNLMKICNALLKLQIQENQRLNYMSKVETLIFCASSWNIPFSNRSTNTYLLDIFQNRIILPTHILSSYLSKT